jgi:hypothetical protein
MPTIGLNWINQSREAFRFWSMTLIGETIEQSGRWGGGPTQILTEALARILNRSLPAEQLRDPKNDCLEQPELDFDEEKKAKKSLAALINENSENTRAAEAFLEDLDARLDTGEQNETAEENEKITVNSRGSLVHVVEENKQKVLFVSIALIEKYAKEHSITSHQMIKQLNQLHVLGNHYRDAQLAIGPEATRVMAGLTLSGRNAALRTDIPALGTSPTLKLHGDATSQRIAQINNGTWPSRTTVKQVDNQNSQQAQETAKMSQNLFSSGR